MKSTTRVWGIALIVSMMVNTFAIGLLLSDRFAPRGFRPPPPDGPAFTRENNSAESRHVRELFQELRASTRQEFVPLMQGIRKARKQVHEVLNSESFSPEKLDAALAELRKAEQAAAEQAHRTISQLAETLSAEERKHLAQLVRRRPPGPGNRMPPGGPPPEGEPRGRPHHTDDAGKPEVRSPH